MNAIRSLILSGVLTLTGALETPAALLLQCQPVGTNLRLILNSQTGTNYQFEISTNLANWADWGTLITGDGLTKTQTMCTAGQPVAFFRVRATQAAADIAPSDATFTALVLHKTLFDYTFDDATHFRWQTETGLWDYAKTSSSTGKLVLTYDADGNNPAIYREEIILTFQSSTQGTYRYSEFSGGTEDPGSVFTGPFDLSGL